MFTEQFKVFHSSCDAKGRLKTDLFQEMILNTACSAAEAGGFGIPELNRHGLTWVMARFQMHLISQPMIGDTLTIETWIEQNRMGFSMRNFRVYRCNESGSQTLSALCRSAWAVIELQSRASVNIKELPCYPEPEGGSVELPAMARPDRKAPSVESSHTIRYSDLDQNGHCNSSRYVQMMIDAYGSFDGLFPKNLIVSYSHECFFGDTVTVSHTQTPSPFFAIRNAKGELCATAFFEL